MAYSFVTSHDTDRSFHGYASGYNSIDGTLRFRVDEYFDPVANTIKLVGYLLCSTNKSDSHGVYGRFTFSCAGSSRTITYADSGSMSTSYVQMGSTASFEFANNGSARSVSLNIEGGAAAGYSQFGNTFGFDFAAYSGGYIGINAFTSSFSTNAHPSYTLTVDKNDGSAVSTYSHPTGYTQTIDTPTREGYTFNGWTLTGGGSFAGTTYTYGSSNGTLTANWTINTWTVDYDANGGTSTPESQTKTYGIDLTLAVAITKSDESAGTYTVTFDPNGGAVDTASLTSARTTHYTFTQWNTSQDGTGTAYSAGGTYSANADATLYAQWSSNTTTEAITLPTPTRTGYTFAGWATSASASSGVTGSYTPSGNTTLYAAWTINSYAVTLTAGDYIASVSGSGNRNYNSSVTASAVLGSATGYDYAFDGWYDGDTKVSSSQSYMFTMPASAVALTAKGTRTIRSYTLSISAGTGSSISVSRTDSPNAGAATGPLSNGDTVYYGDILSVAFSPDTGYDLATMKINGGDTGASTTHIVTGNVSITSTASLKVFTLSLTASNSGVVVSVLRLSSPIGGGSVGQIFNGATLYYNDVILVSYSLGVGYQLDEHTINGTDFDSGDSYTVTSNTAVVVQASASGFIYIHNEPYLVYVGNGSSYDRYLTQIGNGSSYDAY